MVTLSKFRTFLNNANDSGRNKPFPPLALDAFDTGTRTHSHSNRFTMLWYFSMYHRFSLLYFGIATGRTFVPSAFHTQGQVTEDPAGCTPGRLSSSRSTFIRARAR